MLNLSSFIGHIDLSHPIKLEDFQTQDPGALYFTCSNAGGNFAVLLKNQFECDLKVIKHFCLAAYYLKFNLSPDGRKYQLRRKTKKIYQGQLKEWQSGGEFFREG